MKTFKITLTLEDHLPGLQRIVGVLNRGRTHLTSLEYKNDCTEDNLSLCVQVNEPMVSSLLAHFEKIVEVSNITFCEVEK